MRRAIVATYTYAEFAVLAFAWLPIWAGVRLWHRKDETHRIAGRWMRRFGKTTSAVESPINLVNDFDTSRVFASSRFRSATITTPDSAAFADNADRSAAWRIFYGMRCS